MGRRKALPADFDGKWTEDMLSERQRAILHYVKELQINVIYHYR